MSQSKRLNQSDRIVSYNKLAHIIAQGRLLNIKRPLAPSGPSPFHYYLVESLPSVLLSDSQCIKLLYIEMYTLYAKISMGKLNVNYMQMLFNQGSIKLYMSIIVKDFI